jgi:hypothetical protein
MLKRFVLGAAAAAALFTSAPLLAQTKVDFVLNWVPGGDHAPYYYAKKLGWYTQAGIDLQIEPELRHFVYMPLEHSEDLEDQVDCVRLIQALCAETRNTELLRFAELHRDIIDRFGRFPHRNAALGRETTPAEMAFLNEGGFAG